MNKRVLVACINSNRDEKITVVGRKLLEAAAKIEAAKTSSK